MSIAENKQIALRFFKEGLSNIPNWEQVWDELISTDIIYHFNSASEPIVGLEACKTFNASLSQGFPDLQHIIEDVIAEDDKVMLRTTERGTHTGEFLGIPPTGKSGQLNAFTLLRLKNGKIVERWYESNFLELMKQLNLMPDGV
jgi:steroid delta-isomerase-like uncharacterized protein